MTLGIEYNQIKEQGNLNLPSPQMEESKEIAKRAFEHAKDLLKSKKLAQTIESSEYVYVPMISEQQGSFINNPAIVSPKENKCPPMWNPMTFEQQGSLVNSPAIVSPNENESPPMKYPITPEQQGPLVNNPAIVSPKENGSPPLISEQQGSYVSNPAIVSPKVDKSPTISPVQNIVSYFTSSKVKRRE